MSLLDIFRRRRRAPWRYLRGLHQELRGIRLALEHANALVAATHPGVEQALIAAEAELAEAEAAGAGDSAVSYVDPFLVGRVDQEQARIYRATGVMMDADQVFERLVQEGRIES